VNGYGVGDLARAVHELVVIDAETRMRDFTRGLRWNQAHYRLAQGL
jgi:L-arabinose isomerase